MLRLRSLTGVIVLLLLLVTLSGCARYRPRTPLIRINSGIVDKTSSALALEYHIFDRYDCMQYLDRDVIAQGYQPIHITFTNHSDRYISFSTACFSFPCITAEEVAEKVHTNTAGRVVGYGVGSLFFPLLVIPAIVDGIGSSSANRQLDMDYSRKALRSQIVHPFSSIDGLVFTPIKSFVPDFTLSVTDIQTSKSYKLVAKDACLLPVLA